MNLKALIDRERLVSVLRGQLRANGIRPPQLAEEHRFHPVRRFKFDFALPELRIAVECEGGLVLRDLGRPGRHTSPKGYESDCTKYNLAAAMGWCVLRYTLPMIVRGEAIAQVLAVLEAKRRAARA